VIITSLGAGATARDAAGVVRGRAGDIGDERESRSLEYDLGMLEIDPEFTGIDYGYEIISESIDRLGREALPEAIAATERLLSRPEDAPRLDNSTLLPIQALSAL
jgi:hypothetical protein